MGILSKLFFFKRTDVNLENKWWHRFFVVIFFIFVVAFFGLSLFIAGSLIPETDFNVDIKYNLREFTKTSSKDVVNTIPAFNLLNYKIGCLEDGKIGYISTYYLEKSICSSDLRGNIDKVAEIFLKNNPLIKDTKEQAISGLTKVLDTDTETRYCFIQNEVGCSSDKIVTYKRNIIYHLEFFLAPLVSTYLFILILRFIYFKGFIYIIYGKKK